MGSEPTRDVNAAAVSINKSAVRGPLTLKIQTLREGGRGCIVALRGRS